MYKSSPTPIFYPGLNNTPYYRVPALLLLENGTLIAGADQMMESRNDWGKINPVLLFKKEEGKEFENFTKVIEMDGLGSKEPAFNIDMTLVYSKKMGRLYMLIDTFKSAGSFLACESGPSHKEIDGEICLIIYDKSNNAYYVRKDGTVIDRPELYVQMTDTHPFSKLYNIYEDGKFIGNVFNDKSAYQVHQSSFLWLLCSDDNGSTWHSPIDITGQVRDPRMKFIGTGPGVSLELNNGRLLFPIYYSIDDGDRKNKEVTAVIYTDDGVNFKRSRSINYEKNTDGLVGDLPINTSESQQVELNNGHVLIFVKNTSDKVLYAISKNFGESFSDPMELGFDSTPTCMVTVLKIERDGSEYILLANPDGPNRNNGSIKILRVNDDDSLTYIGKKSINDKFYAYSCLAYSPRPDTYCLLYEEEINVDGTDRDILMYTEFDQEWLFN